MDLSSSSGTVIFAATVFLQLLVQQKLSKLSGSKGYLATKKRKQNKERAANILSLWRKLSMQERQWLVREIRSNKLEMTRRLRRALDTGVDVCIDLAYESLHSDFEVKSIARQVSNIYAIMKRAACPVHLHLTSLTEDSTLKALRLSGLENWIISKHTAAPWDIWPSSMDRTLVMLSPDAPEAVSVFSADCVYIVGGIVDRSVKAKQTLNVAKDHGVICRRLPIREFAPHNKSHVLNIDCCLHIISTQLETGDWAETFRRCLPKRKSTALKGVNSDTDNSSSSFSLEELAANSRWQRWVEREVGLENPKYVNEFIYTNE